MTGIVQFRAWGQRVEWPCLLLALEAGSKSCREGQLVLIVCFVHVGIDGYLWGTNRNAQQSVEGYKMKDKFLGFDQTVTSSLMKGIIKVWTSASCCDGKVVSELISTAPQSYFEHFGEVYPHRFNYPSHLGHIFFPCLCRKSSGHNLPETSSSHFL